MSYLISLLSLTLIISCSSTPSDRELISFGDTLADTKEELEARLTKISYEQGGDYEFKAFPISETMIKIDVNNIAQIRGFEKEETELLYKLRSQKYSFEKNCLQVNINKIGLTKNNNIKNWNIFLVDNLGRRVPTTPSRGTVRNYQTLFTGLYGKNQIAVSEGVICTRVKVDITKGFQLQFIGKRDSVESTLNWSI
tara:strand:- start:666 stop:1253 length:588 start_codon:yes stop_codon:yes gene_type:complete